MHISHIFLENLRGFKELNFDLAHSVDAQGQSCYAGWIVFVGDNGSGKSSLLKAIAAGLLSEKHLDSLEPNRSNWIRKGEDRAGYTLNIEQEKRDDHFANDKIYPIETGILKSKGVYADNDRSQDDPLFDIAHVPHDDLLKLAPLDNSTIEKFAENQVEYWLKHWLKQLPETTKRVVESAGIREKSATSAYQLLMSDENKKNLMLINLTYLAMTQGPLADNATGWFSCGYGPFRRVFGASQEATQLMTGEVVERFATLFNEAASLFEADRWLRDLRYKTLEGNESAKAQLELVLELLRDEFMPNQITLKGVNSDGLWLEDRNGLRLAWRDMSDGYRAALALLCDILRHLIRKFGVEGLAARNAEGRLYITRSGVVLIDEVDAHLHPEWQREISGWLKRHFPHIQFLVTTHSPLICQAADKIFVLPEPGSDELPYALSDAQLQEVRASKSDAVLRSPAFGLQNTRSELAVENLAEFSKLRSKQRAGATLTPAESTRLAELDNFIHADKEL
ncbi:MAG: AAA family ATPase [Gallionella sp.]